MSEIPYDRDVWQTWPIPEHGINTRHPDGRPWRLSEYGEGWVDGWEMCCQAMERNLAEINEAITARWNPPARSNAMIVNGNGWRSTESDPPPDGVVVQVKNNGGALLKRSGNLWFFPDESMYVYYWPEFWRPVDSVTP